MVPGNSNNGLSRGERGGIQMSFANENKAASERRPASGRGRQAVAATLIWFPAASASPSVPAAEP